MAFQLLHRQGAAAVAEVGHTLRKHSKAWHNQVQLAQRTHLRELELDLEQLEVQLQRHSAGKKFKRRLSKSCIARRIGLACLGCSASSRCKIQTRQCLAWEQTCKAWV